LKCITELSTITAKRFRTLSPKRVASNANEKAISLRDSSAYNVIYQTNADTTPDFCPADQCVSFYGYAKWNLVTNEETDFGVTLRASGAGYMMLVAYWDCDATDSNGKQSTMGIEEIKFERIDNWSSVDDWSLL